MITISPGHWKPGTGASGLIDEVTEARKVVNRVHQILNDSGITTNLVIDNTSKTKNENLTYLVKQHNNTKRELDVSVHFNSSAGGTQSKGLGVETLYYDAKTLADSITKAISTASGLIARSSKQRKELYFLNATAKKAVLLEICFVNSSVDVALYKRDFEKICQAIATELAKAVGRTLKVSTKPVAGKFEVVGDDISKVWRIQSGTFKSKDEAIKAFEKSGLSYATIKGSDI